MICNTSECWVCYHSPMLCCCTALLYCVSHIRVELLVCLCHVQFVWLVVISFVDLVTCVSDMGMIWVHVPVMRAR